MDQKWELWGKGVMYGTLFLEQVDQPWFDCRFDASDAFREIEPLFSEELRLLNESTYDEWERAYDAIDLQELKLRSSENHGTIDDFLLHIEGTHAWFRYE